MGEGRGRIRQVRHTPPQCALGHGHERTAALGRSCVLGNHSLSPSFLTLYIQLHSTSLVGEETLPPGIGLASILEGIFFSRFDKCYEMKKKQKATDVKSVFVLFSEHRVM